MSSKIITEYVFYHIYGTYGSELNDMSDEEFVKECVKRACNLKKDFNERFSVLYNRDIMVDYLVDVFHLDVEKIDNNEYFKDMLFGFISEQIELSLFAFAFIDVLRKDSVTSDFINSNFRSAANDFNEKFIKALRKEFYNL